MATDVFKYERGAELPGLTLPWQTETSSGVFEDLDLSSAYSFTLTLDSDAGVTVLTKTTGLTGNVGSVTVAWDVDDLDVAPGRYRLRLRAREVATSKDRDYKPGSPVMLHIVE